jgi:hypothetical protein
MTENIERIKKLVNITMKTVTEHSMSSQAPLGSIMEFARRA